MFCMYINVIACHTTMNYNSDIKCPQRSTCITGNLNHFHADFFSWENIEIYLYFTSLNDTEMIKIIEIQLQGRQEYLHET